MGQLLKDFSLMDVADPSSPPSGMRSWAKTTTPGRIADAGFRRSGATAGLAAWVFDGFIPTDNVIKLETEFGENAAGTLGNSGSGIVFAQDDSGSSESLIGIFLGGALNKEVSYTGNTFNTSTIYNSPTNVIGEKLTVYWDRVNQYAYPFKDGKAIGRRVTLPAGTSLFGVGSTQPLSGALKGAEVTDSGSALPPYVGNINSSLNGAGTDRSFTAGYPATFQYYNFSKKPTFGRINNYPITLSNITNNSLVATFANIAEIVGNVFDLPISAANGPTRIPTVNVKIGNPLENCVYYTRLRGAVNMAAGGSAYVGVTTNLHHYYNLALGKTMPTDSVVFIQAESTYPNSTASISGAGEMLLSNLDNNVGTLVKDFYVIDGVDKILHHFKVTFNKGGEPAGLPISAVYVEKPLVNKFEADLNTVYESNVTMDTAIGSSSVYVTGGAELSYDTGSEWSAWLSPTAGSPLTISSTLNPVPLKLRARSSGLSDKSRTFTITDGGSEPLYTWSIYTKAEGQLFLPDLSQEPNAILVDLINHVNDATIDYDQVTVSNPTTYIGFDSGNTIATVSAVPNQGYTGSVEVNYNRIELERFQDQNDRAIVSVPYNTTWEELVSIFNLTYHTNLIVDDYEVPVGFPSGVESDTTSWTLTAKSSSLIYKGAINLDIRVVYISMEDVVTDTVLNGLVFPL